ncbi:MAG: T9SS type A sorting domain-containing protein [Flavobacteriales bacterium]|nr:T9SS type A sorting domain-containing protein [Flavobacteriales bacterium]
MGKQAALLIGLLGFIPAGAQVTFEKYYEAAGTLHGNLHELSSGNLFTGTAFMYGTSLMDPQGNILHSQCHLVDTVLVVQSVRKVSDNEFYFATFYAIGANGSNPGGHPLLGEMDSLGNVSILHYFLLNAIFPGGGSGIGDIEVVSDKCVIAWDRDNRLFLMKADSTLVHVWSRAFDQEGVFHFVKELPNGDLLAGFDLAGTGASLMRMDANGNTLWSKRYFGPGSSMHDAVIASDGSVVTVGQVNGMGQKLFMMKVDGNGLVQWCKGYTGSAWWASPPRIETALDGNYAVLSSTGSYLTGTGRSVLFKTDTNGDTLWVRRYGVNGVGYSTFDLLVCADGGYAFYGEGYPEGTYIFKADSLGHVPCSGASPASFTITELFPVDSAITLTSVDGATTHTGYITSTPCQPFNVSDGCTTPGVLDRGATAHKPRIRPNPNTGHFTLEFSDPLAADSCYSVYDALGKLLFQRPLAKGQTSEEIDLSRFGKGTYLVRITSKDGVCNERVVVQ